MTNPETFQKDNVSDGEFEVYRVLNSPEVLAYNEAFARLILPQSLDQDEETRTLTLPYYEGRTFNDEWDIKDGGSSMDLELAYVMPELIEDLSHIDRTSFTHDEQLSQVPNLAFDHQASLKYFGNICLNFTEEGILSEREHAKAEELLHYQQTTDLIVSNGDFYPRNLIFQPDGKVVLIDWEVWNDHSPFFLIDHPENVAAVQYVHMWGNPRWQATFRDELDKHFSFQPKSFDKGIVIKALTLASFFRNHQELFRGQIGILKRVLGD